MYYACEGYRDCLKRCYIKYNPIENNCELFLSDFPHFHHNKKFETKQKIESLLVDNKIKNKDIISKLKEENIHIEPRQLENFKFNQKKKLQKQASQQFNKLA